MTISYSKDSFETAKSTPIYNARATAAEYITLGFSVIPVSFKGKNPTIPEWQNLRIGTADIESWFPVEASNIGVILGSPSGGLVDIDLDDNGALQFAKAFLPSTDMVFGRASRSSSHWLYRVPSPGKPRKLAASGKTIVELRSTGQQTVFPGSVHPSGELISFETHGRPAEVTWEELEQGIVKIGLATVLCKRWTSGNRHALALSLAGFLQKCEWSEKEVETLIHVVAKSAKDEDVQDRLTSVRTTFNSARCGNPVSGRLALIDCLDEATVRDFEKWLGVQASKAVHAATTPSDLATDAGCADAFAAEQEGSLIYSDTKSQWYRRSNKIFELISLEIVQGMVKGFLQEKATSNPRDFTKALLSRSRINAAVELSRSQLWADSEQFDSDKTVVGCADGTVMDLGSEQLLHEGNLCIVTRRLGASFNLEAKCPTWEGFLDKIFDGNNEVINFLQRSVGYSLSGSTAEQVFFILVGTGANGKSTFLRTMMQLMGDYGTTLPMQTLMVQSSGGQTNDLATLPGKRFVAASEGESKSKAGRKQNQMDNRWRPN